MIHKNKDFRIEEETFINSKRVRNKKFFNQSLEFDNLIDLMKKVMNRHIASDIRFDTIIITTTNINHPVFVLNANKVLNINEYEIYLNPILEDLNSEIKEISLVGVTNKKKRPFVCLLTVL